MGKNFFVVELEFTQYTKPVGRLRFFFPEIIEIGAVRIVGDTNAMIGHIQSFVKPHFFVKQAAESLAFCMSTESDMKTAVDFSGMLRMIDSLYIPARPILYPGAMPIMTSLAKGVSAMGLTPRFYRKTA